MFTSCRPLPFKNNGKDGEGGRVRVETVRDTGGRVGVWETK